jgi:hypothetical protein
MGSRWRLVVLAGLFALVTACAGDPEGGDGVASMSDGGTSSSAAPADDEPDIDKMREYASCMKKHGIEVEVSEPESGGKGGGMGISVDGADKEKVEKADKECKKLLPNGGEPPKPSAEDLDRARKMAQCLREHGLDVPDPTMEDPGIKIDGRGGDQAKVDEAMKACQPEGAESDTKLDSGGGGK